MQEQSRIVPRWLFWVLNLFLWTFIAALQGIQSYTSTLSEGYPAEFSQTFLVQLATYYPWAVFSPILFTYVQRFPVDRLFSVRTLVLLPLIGFLCVVLQVASHTAGMVLFPPPSVPSRAFFDVFPRMLRWMSFSGLLTFSAIIGACHGINFFRRFREREVLASKLEKELTEARLQALHMQLQPHFFFNTLHAIASLVRDRQNDAAVTMIARLSDLFRYTLNQVKTQKIPLRQEIEFLSGYLEIEQARFPDRLHIEIRIEPETEDALVPTLFLQPLIENSIEHGISKLTSRGTLSVSARRADSNLVVSILNDGKGLDLHWREHVEGSIGLSNTRRRLQELYGSNFHFDLREEGAGQIAATVSIPFESETRGKQ